MNVYMTGGHLTPALAVIDYIRKKHDEVHLFFIGREHSQEYPRVISHEQREVEARGVPFFAIQAAKFYRERFWLNVVEFFKLPASFLEVAWIFYKRRPDVVLSFGGYVAFPACVMGKLFGAKVVTHEQTRAAGLANQVISFLADVVAISNEASLKFFPKEKTVVTGNPVRESLLKEYKTPPDWFPTSMASQSFLYITGGSQGSQIINHTVALLLPKLLKNFVIVHQCGTSPDGVYLSELNKVRDSLPTHLRSRYFVREWIEAREVSYLMRNAKFVVSRAGANTVLELSLSGTPAIFIPLSFAYKNEQERNAREMANAGSAVIILQKDLVPETLYQAILRVNRRFERMKAAALSLKAKSNLDGTKSLVDLVLKTPAIKPNLVKE